MRSQSNFTDASQSGHSHQISKYLLCDLQCDTQIQTDRSATEWLIIIHAAISRAVWRTAQRIIVFCTRPCQHDCLEGEMMDHHFSCFCVGKLHRSRMQSLMPVLLPQQPMQRSRCLDTQMCGTLAKTGADSLS